ncbi:hypothetical protein LINGRAPRIM_LOCUS1298, partial [Linum grandiflorum]
ELSQIDDSLFFFVFPTIRRQPKLLFNLPVVRLCITQDRRFVGGRDSTAESFGTRSCGSRAFQILQIVWI